MAEGFIYFSEIGRTLQEKGDEHSPDGAGGATGCGEADAEDLNQRASVPGAEGFDLELLIRILPLLICLIDECAKQQDRTRHCS